MEMETAAGLLLIIGFLTFILGISTPNYTGLDQSVWDVPHTKDHLDMIAAHMTAWQWARGWTVVSAFLIAFGLFMLTKLSSLQTLQMMGNAAFLTSFSAALLWAVAMGFQMGVEPFAGVETGKDAAIPNWFKFMEMWGLMLMLMVMIIGYISTAFIGLTLLYSAWAPPWLGWLSLIIGVLGGTSMITNWPRYPGTQYSIAGIPLWLYIIPLVLGIKLLI